MCVHQAVEAIRLFTGIEPDLARLHRTFATALVARDAMMAEAIDPGPGNRREIGATRV